MVTYYYYKLSHYNSEVERWKTANFSWAYLFSLVKTRWHLFFVYIKMQKPPECTTTRDCVISLEKSGSSDLVKKLWNSFACYEKVMHVIKKGLVYCQACVMERQEMRNCYKKNTKIAILFFHFNYYGSLSLLYMYSIYIYIYIYCSIIQVFYILWHVVVYVKMISTQKIYFWSKTNYFLYPQKLLRKSFNVLDVGVIETMKSTLCFNW